MKVDSQIEVVELCWAIWLAERAIDDERLREKVERVRGFIALRLPQMTSNDMLVYSHFCRLCSICLLIRFVYS